MKRKLWQIGNLAVALCGVGLMSMIAFAPNPTIRWTASFVATMLLAMFSVDVVGVWLDKKRAEKPAQKSLRFLVVCEDPKTIGCPSVADAVTDYLCLLLNPATGQGGHGLSYDFIDVAGAVSKIEEDLARPESERYKIVFVDASAIKVEDYLPARIQLRIGDEVGPVIVIVGNHCPAYFAQLPFKQEEWIKDRKTFQRGLGVLLKTLNLLPERAEGEALE